MASDAELRLRERLSRLKSISLLGGAKLSGELERLQKQLDRMRAEPTEDEIWRSVELARDDDRPYTLDYVERLLEDWVELHGDRGRGDDAAVVCGLGSFDGRTVALVGHQKGRDVKERLDRQFGMAYPEGYHKAMRVMEIAERFGFPLVSLVDTPSAYPGVAAEQHGQGGAIARSQATLSRLHVPVVACVIGEGGSGGAIATALADRFGYPLITLVDTPGAYPGVAAEQHGQGGAIAASQATMLRLGLPIVRNFARRSRRSSSPGMGSSSSSAASREDPSKRAASSWSVCAPSTGSGTIASITPSSRQCIASGLNAAAAFCFSPPSRHRIEAAPSGEITM